MNPGINYYMPFGLPATGYFTVTKVPTSNVTLTVGERTYTFNTDFFGANVRQIVESLTAAINATRTSRDEIIPNAINNNPINSVFARWADNRVYVIATVPGAAGNAISIGTDVGGAIDASLDFLNGGVDGPGLSGATGLRDSVSGLKLTVATGLAANPKRLYWGIINLNTLGLVVKMGAGATATDMDFPLIPASSLNYGDGGSVFEDTYKGAVSVFEPSGSYRYNVIEMEAP